MLKNTNDNKGITLVALVVTIVVLLILVSISVRSLTGDEGLIKRTENAVTEVNETTTSVQSNLNELFELRERIQ